MGQKLTPGYRTFTSWEREWLLGLSPHQKLLRDWQYILYPSHLARQLKFKNQRNDNHVIKTTAVQSRVWRYTQKKAACLNRAQGPGIPHRATPSYRTGPIKPYHRVLSPLLYKLSVSLGFVVYQRAEAHRIPTHTQALVQGREGEG